VESPAELQAIDAWSRTANYLSAAQIYLTADPLLLAPRCRSPLTGGVGIWDWAGAEDALYPDVVMACAGDAPTLETMAAIDFLRHRLPELRVRGINVLDLMRLPTDTEHPHVSSFPTATPLFTTYKPVTFACHGLAHRPAGLSAHQQRHGRAGVQGGRDHDQGFGHGDDGRHGPVHLVMDVIDRVPGLRQRAASLQHEMIAMRVTAGVWTR